MVEKLIVIIITVLFISILEICIGYSRISLFAITFVSDLWQVSVFHRVLRFPPLIKLTTTI